MSSTYGIPFTEQPSRYTIDRRNGIAYERRWEGRASDLRTIASALEGTCESISLDVDGDMAVLTARYAGNPDDPTQVVPEVHDIENELVVQSIFAAPYFLPLPAAVQQAIKKEIDDPTAGKTGLVPDYDASVDAIKTACAKVNAPQLTAKALEAFDLMLSGMDSFEISTWKFTRTRQYSARYPEKVALKGIDKTWSPAQLVAYAGNPYLFNYPTAPVTSDDIAKKLLAGWRMRLQRIRMTANGTYEVVEEWLLGKHYRNAYPQYSGI